MPAGWRDLEEIEAIRRELVSFLEDEFGRKPLWGVKDPRLCRLLPLWLDVLEELGAEPLFVVVVRNPLEVARSLEERDRFSASKCLLLYMAEMLAAIPPYSREAPGVRVVRAAARGLALSRGRARQAVGGRVAPCPREPAHEIDAFLRPSERHHRHDVADLRDEVRLPDWCVALHEALEQASRGHDQGLDAAVRRAHESFASVTALFMPELEALEKEKARVEQRAARAESELFKVQRQLTSILSSRLYRFTRPFRHTWHGLARFRK
jgi:hypothetical protein